MNNQERGSLEEIFVKCMCHSPEHQMMLSFFSNGEDEQYEELYVTFHLSQYRNLLKRIWVAIRYVLGYKSQFGDWDEIILDKRRASRIARFLDKYLES
jgi:hypothetical protein